MAIFDDAVKYVLENVGVDFNHPSDRGGRTRYGITHATAHRHGLDVTLLTLEQAKNIYRADYWIFDDLRDGRLAAKCLDVVVNFGLHGGTSLIQRAVGTVPDGKYGAKTSAALQKLNTEDAIERISYAAADHYVEICRANPSQLAFLKGWMRRAIRRPALQIKGV